MEQTTGQALEPPAELGSVVRFLGYKISLKTMTWATLAEVAVMALLFGFISFPPSFGTFQEAMYFHSIGIGLAALAVYLILDTFKLYQYEPPMDFPIAYRAFSAVLFGAAGGVVYLIPAIGTVLPGLGTGLFIVAFILLADVGGALFLELMLLPRKQAGTYKPKANYLMRMLPLTRADLAAYRDAGAGYWLAIAAVGSAFLAGLAGFAYLFVYIFGPGILTGWLSFVGVDAPTFLDMVKDPHSHEMALAIMAGVVAIVVVRFGLSETVSRVRRAVTQAGAWIAVVGVIAMTVVLMDVAAFNYSPPTLFMDPLGNGVAGDDMAMSIIGLGAMVALVPMIMSRRVWKDSVRLTVLGTWIAAVVLNVVEGFYIEFHEDIFSPGGNPTANDTVFASAQPVTAVFLLTALAVAMIIVDYYAVKGIARRLIGWTAAAGLVVVTAGMSLWTFVDPTTGGAFFWLYIAGVVVIGLSVLFAGVAIRPATVVRITRREVPGDEARGKPAGDYLIQHSWEPEATATAVSMLQQITAMADAGALPEGVSLRTMQLIPGEARALSTWDAPSKKELEGFVMKVNLPKIRVVYELRNLY